MGGWVVQGSGDKEIAGQLELLKGEWEGRW